MAIRAASSASLLLDDVRTLEFRSISSSSVSEAAVVEEFTSPLMIERERCCCSVTRSSSRSLQRIQKPPANCFDPQTWLLQRCAMTGAKFVLAAEPLGKVEEEDEEEEEELYPNP